MEKFLSTMKPDNKENFAILWRKNRLKKLRKDLYEHILSNTENSYFELDNWAKQNYNNNVDDTQEMIEITIIPELEKLGWTCKTSFGNTALFIYSTEKPPQNCYEDTF